MSYTLNLHNLICQLYPSKSGGKNGKKTLTGEWITD